MTTWSAETAEEFYRVRFALFSEHTAARFRSVVHESVRTVADESVPQRGARE